MKPYPLESIKQSFPARDIDQVWQDPDLQDFPWEERDFISWKHPHAGHYFACLDTPEGLRGIIFQMNSGMGRSSGYCDLCFASNREIGIKPAFIEQGSNPRRKIGIYVCGDLACSQRVRGQKSAYFMYETISVGRRIERLQMRLQSLWKKV